MNERYSSKSCKSMAAYEIGGSALEAIEGLQSELDLLRAQLAQSNRLGQLGMLTAVLAHEMNNYLTPMRSYAQLALANPDDTSLADRALHASVEGSRKASALAERVIGLASPNSSIQTGVCIASDAVESAIEALKPVIKQGGIEIRLDLVAAEVSIDALALEQVLINLITNASQAMQGGSVKRQLRIESFIENSRYHFIVRDTGPGIANGVRSRLFEPFVSQRSGEQSAGSGLGLSICKQIIEAAGGSIDLAFTSEAGSAFAIDLPVHQSE